MENKTNFSIAAQRDLDNIWEYIEADLQSAEAARRTVGKILDAIERLESFPDIGAPLSSVMGAASDYRFLVCGNYLVFYRVNSGAVYIDRILYGRRDYIKILFKDYIQ